MLTLTALALAPSATPDGRLLSAGTQCFAITATRGEAKSVIGNVLQTVHRRNLGGVDALEIVVHQKLTNGKFDLRDEFLVRRDNLRPIRLISVRNGIPHVRLDYSASKVSGWKEENGIKKPVMVALPGPVWDGNLWGLTFASLPLRTGGSYTLPMYQYDKGLGEFSVNVKGKKPVQVGQKNVTAWVLDAGVAKDRRSEYLVSPERAELGYSAGPMSQSLGGVCSSFGKVAGS